MNIKNMTEEQLVLAQKWIDAIKKIVYKEFSSVDTEKFNTLYEKVKEMEHLIWEQRRIKPFAETHVFDEEQTVKWNREMVEKENQKRVSKMQELISTKNAIEKEQTDLLYEEVENAYGIPRKAAEKLWSKAYDDGHSDGFYRVLDIFEEYLDLFKETLCACVEEKYK